MSTFLVKKETTKKPLWLIAYWNTTTTYAYFNVWLEGIKELNAF